MCQINACERASNQSRLRETRLMLKLYYTDSTDSPRLEQFLRWIKQYPTLCDCNGSFRTSPGDHPLSVPTPVRWKASKPTEPLTTTVQTLDCCSTRGQTDPSALLPVDKALRADLRGLKDFWSERKDDENEAFLRDYILNDR